MLLHITLLLESCATAAFLRGVLRDLTRAAEALISFQVKRRQQADTLNSLRHRKMVATARAQIKQPQVHVQSSQVCPAHNRTRRL